MSTYERREVGARCVLYRESYRESTRKRRGSWRLTRWRAVTWFNGIKQSDASSCVIIVRVNFSWLYTLEIVVPFKFLCELMVRRFITSRNPLIVIFFKEDGAFRWSPKKPRSDFSVNREASRVFQMWGILMEVGPRPSTDWKTRWLVQLDFLQINLDSRPGKPLKCFRLKWNRCSSTASMLSNARSWMSGEGVEVRV